MKVIIAHEGCIEALAALDERVNLHGILTDTWLWERHINENRVITTLDDMRVPRAYALLDIKPDEIFISRLQHERGSEQALVPLMERIVKLAEHKGKCLRAWTDDAQSVEMELFQLFNFEAENPKIKRKSKGVIPLIYRPV